jgi:malate dehydrogenase (oxaloacetate-decarboxylating)
MFSVTGKNAFKPARFRMQPRPIASRQEIQPDQRVAAISLNGTVRKVDRSNRPLAADAQAAGGSKTMNIRRPHEPVKIALTGENLINDPVLNKGTAFSETERNLFDLNGLLPPLVGTMDDQVARRMKMLRSFHSDLQRYAFLRELQDTNETLFYAVLTNHLQELLPIVYAPTVGEACQRFSDIWRKPRGIFLSYPCRGRIRDLLADPRYDKVRVVVATDGEQVLGLGDQGAGGMGLSIGKAIVHTACAGIPPHEVLPIVLDVGTNNEERLSDPLYVGWRHSRIRGDDYDAFIEEFVTAISERWPDAILQWGDFSSTTASALLRRYRDRLCTFNDDLQSAAATASATVMAAVKTKGEALQDQRIVLFGAGKGCSVGKMILELMVEDGLPIAEARKRFFAIDERGLLLAETPNTMPSQAFLLQPKADLARWSLQTPGRISLLDVVHNVKPTVLIGTSGLAGAFDEDVVRCMASNTRRPIILPLSSQASKSEATPADLIAWTEGRALVATGSPFAPALWKGRMVEIDQIDSCYIFPGMALGILACGARRASDAMFRVAARAVAEFAAVKTDECRLLPSKTSLRSLAVAVAKAVGRQAQADGLAGACSPDILDSFIESYRWDPCYRQYEKIQLIDDHGDGPSRSSPLRGGLAPWQLRRAIDHLTQNLADGVCLSELAEQVGLSQAHFSRQFKISTGLPPHRYKLATRIERAKQLLLHGDLSLKEIALSCGFFDQGHLSKAFRRMAGLSPRAWQRDNRP